MSQTDTRTGFILHSYRSTSHGRDQIYAIGCLANGETFGLIEQRYRPHFYIATEDLQHAQAHLDRVRVQDCNRHGMDGKDLVEISADTQNSLRRISNVLQKNHVPTYEADLSLERSFFSEHQICGGVTISGEWKNGTQVDWIVYNPQLQSSLHIPDVSVLSLDIETNAEATLITAISLIARGKRKKNNIKIVLVLDPALTENTIHYMFTYKSEAELLEACMQSIQQCDPDIITGWNVIDFDFKVIEERCKAHRIPLRFGRSKDDAYYREGKRWGTSKMHVPGRQVLDAMHLVRHTLSRYEDYKLETVAQATLGRGKLLQADDQHSMLEHILQTYQDDKQLFAAYCLEDAQLVLDILDKEDLLLLTLNRAALTGTPLERAWGSVEGFEYLYICGLHQRNIVARSVNEEERDPDHAPGGYVMNPQVGLYDHIFIFDFKSLYPSIIRTFNIDPLAYAQSLQLSDSSQCLHAPNDASFVRERGILPNMLDIFWEKRAAAKADNNDLASYTYKIVMNSFYGVLGSSGCRFAKPQLAGAITHFGHFWLKWCRDVLEELGYDVLYGDTDSVFVDAHLDKNISNADAQNKGDEICRMINQRLSTFIQEHYDVPSLLELEFEKHYHKLLLPPSRDDDEVGRAKGYAGLLIKNDEEHIDIVGLEAVRRDWTDFAHEFQRELFELLFAEKNSTEIEQFINQQVNAVHAGEKDDLLIYRRALRKPVESYTKTTPPHVKAARMLENPSGLIHYVMTIHGPQPMSKRSSAIDYEHYITKQIEPIITAIASFCGIDINRALTGEQRFL